jgi:hypothetical protein
MIQHLVYRDYHVSAGGRMQRSRGRMKRMTTWWKDEENDDTRRINKHPSPDRVLRSNGHVSYMRHVE